MNIDFYSFDCFTLALGYFFGEKLNRFYQNIGTVRYFDQQGTPLTRIATPGCIAIASIWKLHSAMIGERSSLRRSSTLLFSTKQLSSNTAVRSHLWSKYHRSAKNKNFIFFAVFAICHIIEHFITLSSKDLMILHKDRLTCLKFNRILLKSATAVTAVAMVALTGQKYLLLPLAVATGALVPAICKRYAPDFYQSKYCYCSNINLAILICSRYFWI